MLKEIPQCTRKINETWRKKKQNKSKLALSVQHSEVISFVVIALSGT